MIRQNNSQIRREKTYTAGIDVEKSELQSAIERTHKPDLKALHAKVAAFIENGK